MSRNLQLLTLLTTLALFSQTSCIPLIVAGGASAVGYTAAQERSLGETATDTSIIAQIKTKLARAGNSLFTSVSVKSVQGRVLLTGIVPTREARVQAYNLAWEVKGVNEVINEIQVDKDKKFSATAVAKDTWISTQIKSRLLFAKEISSQNYSVETINGNVYLMGIAKTRDELDFATQIASEVPGVVKVVSYVKLKGSTSKVSNNNGSGNSVSNTEVESQTIPGSASHGAGTIPVQSGDLVIEDSPNAQ